MFGEISPKIRSYIGRQGISSLLDQIAVPPIQGAKNPTTYDGAILYRGHQYWQLITPGSAGQALLSGGPGGAPVFGALDISSSATVGGILFPNAGGTGASALTQGSIPFIGGSGIYTEDHTNLKWNNTNKVLNIGNNVETLDQFVIGGDTVHVASDFAMIGYVDNVANQYWAAGLWPIDLSYRIINRTAGNTIPIFVINKSTNYIGIGTALPVAPIDVFGSGENMYINNSDANGYSILRIGNPNSDIQTSTSLQYNNSSYSPGGTLAQGQQPNMGWLSTNGSASNGLLISTTVAGAPINFVTGYYPYAIVPNVTIADPATGSCLVTINNTGGGSNDQLTVINSDSGSGQTGFLLSNTVTGGRDFRLMSSNNGNGTIGGGKFAIQDNGNNFYPLVIDGNYGSIGFSFGGAATPTSTSGINIQGLPTSNSGLSSGDLWRDNSLGGDDVLRIV